MARTAGARWAELNAHPYRGRSFEPVIPVTSARATRSSYSVPKRVEPGSAGRHCGYIRRMDVGVNSVLADRYVLGAPLGRGGMAEVRAAHDRRLDRTVAVKIFDAAGWATPEGRARFEIEAHLAASVAHPNVVVVYDVGIDGNVPFLVMECLPGTTLADEIRAGKLGVCRATTIAGEVLDALAAAHARGVLHRDLKPANVLIAADGHTKLTDFGIATSDTLLELTAAGMVIGTPAYLAPERLAGKRATVRSDLYAVGIMCYEALTGTRPFNGDTPIALAYAAQHARPEPLRQLRDDVSPELESVLMRAIARRPEDRFASAAEFARALDAAGRERATVADEHATIPAASVAATQVLPPVTRPSALPRRGRGRQLSPAVFAAILVFIALTAGALAFRHRDSARPGTTPTTVTTPTPAAGTLPPSLRAPFDSLQKAVLP
jgi:eukaryotic-like serine/threonine-protein kinase